MVEILLDDGAMGLVMSSEFTRQQRSKLKKIERPIYIRNVDGTFNKKRPIKHIVEMNIYFQRHRERIEIDVIEGQKWHVILGMPWLAYHNPEIDWRMGEVKMTRCPEECGKQWRSKQRKSGWEKQKEEMRGERAEKGKNNRSEESGRRMGDLG